MRAFLKSVLNNKILHSFEMKWMPACKAKSANCDCSNFFFENMQTIIQIVRNIYWGAFVYTSAARSRSSGRENEKTPRWQPRGVRHAIFPAVSAGSRGVFSGEVTRPAHACQLRP